MITYDIQITENSDGEEGDTVSVQAPTLEAALQHFYSLNLDYQVLDVFDAATGDLIYSS